MIDRSDITVKSEKQSELADVDVLVLDKYLVAVGGFLQNIYTKALRDKCDFKITAIAHVIADRVVLATIGIERRVLSGWIYLSVIFDTSVTIEQFNDAHGVCTL